MLQDTVRSSLEIFLGANSKRSRVLSPPEPQHSAPARPSRHTQEVVLDALANSTSSTNRVESARRTGSNRLAAKGAWLHVDPTRWTEGVPKCASDELGAWPAWPPAIRFSVRSQPCRSHRHSSNLDECTQHILRLEKCHDLLLYTIQEGSKHQGPSLASQSSI